MLLVLEIVLTIAAWKRGWKRWALLPLGAVLVLGFSLGLSEGSLGLNQDVVTHFAPLLDVLGVIVLGIMVAARKPVAQVPPSFGAPAQNIPYNIQAGTASQPLGQSEVPPSPFAQANHR
jgi:hypothetical protein